MATVQSILRRKGGQVVSIGADETALAAATLMNEKAIGGLVVMDGDRIVGVFTERDVLRRVVAARKDPATTLVREVMTSPVACCRLDTSLEECQSVMTAKRIRHLPVVERERLCGIVTIGDLMAEEVGEHQATIEYLQSYIFGGR